LYSRKEANISGSGSSFVKVLRSYQTGGITYSDFLEQVNRYLAAGESPSELLDVLRRRQRIEPLPDFAHDAVARLLNEPSLSMPEELAAPEETPETPVVAPAPAPPPLAAQPAPVAQTPPSRPPPLAVRPAPVTPTPPPPSPAPPSPPPLVVRSHPAAALRATSEPLPYAIRPAEQEKTVAIPRPKANLSELAGRARVTTSRKPITRSEDLEPSKTTAPGPLELPLGLPLDAPIPAASPSAAIEKTVAIPRGGLPEGDYDAAAESVSDPLFLDLGSIDAGAAPARRASWPRRALWLCAALLVLFVAWKYGRQSTTPPAAGAASSQPSRAVTPAQPTAAAVQPGNTFQDCPTCPKMTVLPTGRFKQGAARDDRDALPVEKPQHIVLIRQHLAISTSELTVGEFREFANATKRVLAGCEVYDGEWHHKVEASWLYPGFTQNADHPVTCVSWSDAVAYAEWLSAKTGHHYRLPSSSEWEYAARAGVDAALPWSPAMQAACEYANVADRSAARRYPKWSVFACKDGYVNTSAVASFKANAFGIYDMLGNVLEWTEDCWHDDYSKAPVDGSARMDGDCVEHELRGSSWFSSPAFVRLSYRNHSASGYRSSSVGVRLVRDLNR